MTSPSGLQSAGISVIVPAFNAERFLRATVQSVLAQEVQLEVVIVDDGSTDCTGALSEELARSDTRVTVLHQRNRGLALARNAGLRQAREHLPFVLFLDADDLVEPGALLRLAEELSRSPQSPAAHGAARLIDEIGSRVGLPSLRRMAVDGHRAVESSPGEPTTRAVLAVQNCIMSAGAILIRKSAIAAAGGFDPAISATADHDMWFRLAAQGPIAHVPDVVLAYRIHQGSMSKNRGVMRAAGLRMRRQWLAESSADERRFIRAAYRASNVLIAREQWRRVRTCWSGGKVQEIVRSVPMLAYCFAKTLPGVAALILGRGQPRLVSADQGFTSLENVDAR